MLLSYKQNSINLTQHSPLSREKPPYTSHSFARVDSKMRFVSSSDTLAIKFPLLWLSKFTFNLVSLSFESFFLRNCGLALHAHKITKLQSDICYFSAPSVGDIIMYDIWSTYHWKINRAGWLTSRTTVGNFLDQKVYFSSAVSSDFDSDVYSSKMFW